MLLCMNFLLWKFFKIVSDFIVMYVIIFCDIICLFVFYLFYKDGFNKFIIIT